MASKLTTEQLERRLKKLADRREILRLATAAYSVRTDGGFDKIINSRQGEWSDLSPGYAESKRKRGQDPRKWVRSGRTLKALTQGKLEPKTSGQRGAKIELSRNNIATLLVEAFRPQRGRKPKKRDQRAILFLQDLRRPLMAWLRSEVAAIQKAVAREITLIMAERGGR